MTGTLRTRFPYSLLRDMLPGRPRWHLPEPTRSRILLRRSIHRSKNTPWLVPRSAGATRRPVNHRVIGTWTLTPNPPSLRSPRVRALTHTPNRHLSNCLRTRPPYLITPHVANDHKIRLTPPNILPIFPPPLENLLEKPLTILLHRENFLVTSLLNPSLESPHNSATRAVSPHQRAPCIHHTTTARFQGADTTLPITTFLPPLNPTSHTPNNPLPRSLFSTTLHRVSPELTLVLGASSLIRSQLTKLASSSQVFLRRAHHTILLSRDR